MHLAHERGIYPAARRVLRLPELRRQAGLRRLVHLGQGAHRHPRLALEDLCHDRLARGLCAGIQARVGQPEQAAVAVHLECDQLCAEGRHRRADRFAGVRQRVPRRVHRPARLHAGQAGRAFPASPAPSPKARSTSTRISGAYIGKGGIKTATELATRLLHEAHVVTVPGEAFGTAEHIRISYPVTKQNIDEGTRRMAEFLAKLA